MKKIGNVWAWWTVSKKNGRKSHQEGDMGAEELKGKDSVPREMAAGQLSSEEVAHRMCVWLTKTQPLSFRHLGNEQIVDHHWYPGRENHIATCWLLQPLSKIWAVKQVETNRVAFQLVFNADVYSFLLLVLVVPGCGKFSSLSTFACSNNPHTSLCLVLLKLNFFCANSYLVQRVR